MCLCVDIALTCTHLQQERNRMRIHQVLWWMQGRAGRRWNHGPNVARIGTYVAQQQQQQESERNKEKRAERSKMGREKQKERKRETNSLQVKRDGKRQSQREKYIEMNRVCKGHTGREGERREQFATKMLFRIAAHPGSQNCPLFPP